MKGISTLWVVALAAAAPAAWAQPVVSFAPPEVVASGVTAGGSAVFFTVARELGEDGGTTVVVRRSVAADADGDGVVTYELGGEPALRSLWTAADLASGAVGLGMVEGFERSDFAPDEVTPWCRGRRWTGCGWDGRWPRSWCCGWAPGAGPGG